MTEALSHVDSEITQEPTYTQKVQENESAPPINQFDMPQEKDHQQQEKEHQLNQTKEKTQDSEVNRQDNLQETKQVQSGEVTNDGPPSLKADLSEEPTLQQQSSIQQPNTQVYSLEDRLRDANILKTKGNELYKEKKYAQAIKMYAQGLKTAHAELYIGANIQLYQKMAELNLTLLQNIGTSYFSLNDYATAEQFCSKVIDVNPRHFKAHYRRALCLYELKRYEEAHESIKNAYAIDSTIGQVNQAYKKIHLAWKEEKQQKKELYKSMFSNSSKKEAQLKEAQLKAQQELDKADSRISAFVLGGLFAAASTVAAFGFKAWFKN